jgi:hypothetical protein
MPEHACRFGLEGVISKRADLPYRHWLKSKCVERQEFVILGYVPSTVTTRSVGSLALGYHDNGNLDYAGRVGTGWSRERAMSLRDELEKVLSTKPKFAKPLPAGVEKGVRGPSLALSARSNTAVGPATDCFGRRPSRVSGTTGLLRKSFWRRRPNDHGPASRQIAKASV